MGGDADSYLQQFGRFGIRPGGTVELGVDFAHVGISAGMDYGQTVFAANTGVVAALSLVAHWTPVVHALGDWQPVLTAGFVHEEIDLGPVAAADRTWDFPNATGNGARLGGAVEHRLGRVTAVTIGASADVLSIDQRSPAGTFDVHHRGASIYPRFVVGLRWWPFAS